MTVNVFPHNKLYFHSSFQMKMTKCTKWDADEQCYTDRKFGFQKTKTKKQMHVLYFKKNDAVQLEAVLKWLDAEDL